MQPPTRVRKANRRSIDEGHHQRAILALGGGGARGVAHLGVIEVIQRLSIDIEHFVGVSIGSLAGALCALEHDTIKVQKQVIEYLTSEAFQSKQAAMFMAAPKAEQPATSGLFAWYHQISKLLGARRKLARLFGKPALLEGDIMRNIVDALLPEIDIQDVETPLSIVALDLYSGNQVVLTAGPLREAVMASTAIPGVFPPIEWEDMLLCDIGTMDAIPSRVAKSYGSELTIAVDVCGQTKPVTSCKTAADMFMRLYDIGEPLVRKYAIELADMVIKPDVSHNPWYDFSDPEVLVKLGRDAANSYFTDRKPQTRPSMV